MSKKVIYEIGYLMIPHISDDNILTEVANIKAILEKEEANFLSGNEPKLIDLAYPISKIFGAEKQTFEKAYFAWMKFEVEVDKLVNVTVNGRQPSVKSTSKSTTGNTGSTVIVSNFSDLQNPLGSVITRLST